VRLALHPTGEAGRRAARILLAEPGLAALGIYGSRGPEAAQPRAMAVSDLAGFAVLASDDATAPLDLAAIAVEDGLSCVLAADVEPDAGLAGRFASRGVTLLVAASLPGLAESFAHRAAPEAASPRETLLGWTVEPAAVHGEGRGRRVALPFPEPVGPRWGNALPPRRADGPGVARVEAGAAGPWGGALARVATGKGRRREERLVAAADDRLHLAAIALAGGALLLARGTIPPGLLRPGDAAEPYLAECVGVGLEVATTGGPARS
jgi:hypothetical protein